MCVSERVYKDDDDGEALMSPAGELMSTMDPLHEAVNDSMRLSDISLGFWCAFWVHLTLGSLIFVRSGNRGVSFLDLDLG